MIQRILMAFIAACILGVGGTSCSEDIPDCPNTMCVMAGGWKLTEVYFDNTRQEMDLTRYQLTLLDPNPTSAVTADFNRVLPSGMEDSGEWSLVNNEQVLRLKPQGNDEPTEDWLIESFTPRELILVINRDTSIKGGPGKIRFVLEPF